MSVFWVVILLGVLCPLSWAVGVVFGVAAERASHECGECAELTREILEQTAKIEEATKTLDEALTENLRSLGQ